jgi:hypothetical protein
MVSTNHPLLRVGITFACTFPPPLDCPHLLLHLQDSSEDVVGDHAPPPPSNIAAPDRTTASTVSWRHGEPTTHPPCPASHPWHTSAFFILLAIARPLVSPHRPCHHGRAAGTPQPFSVVGGRHQPSWPLSLPHGAGCLPKEAAAMGHSQPNTIPQFIQIPN